jgi:hypothetical protein
MTVNEQRQSFGLDFHPDTLPTEEMRARWSEGDEQHVLGAFAAEAVPDHVVQSAYEWYLDAAASHDVDYLFTPAAEDAFRAKFTADLGAEFVDRLIRWPRSHA